MSMDAKGRLAVPARYRDRLAESCGGKLIATVSLMHPCLTVYPFPDWQRIEDEIKTLPALDPQVRAISHLLIGHATECDLDTHGRILLPQSLRDFAALDKRVRMVGQVRKFELWNDAAWTAHREELFEQIGELRVQASQSQALRDLVL